MKKLVLLVAALMVATLFPVGFTTAATTEVVGTNAVVATKTLTVKCENVDGTPRSGGIAYYYNPDTSKWVTMGTLTTSGISKIVPDTVTQSRLRDSYITTTMTSTATTHIYKLSNMNLEADDQLGNALVGRAQDGSPAPIKAYYMVGSASYLAGELDANGKLTFPLLKVPNQKIKIVYLGYNWTLTKSDGNYYWRLTATTGRTTETGTTSVGVPNVVYYVKSSAAGSLEYKWGTSGTLGDFAGGLPGGANWVMYGVVNNTKSPTVTQNPTTKPVFAFKAFKASGKTYLPNETTQVAPDATYEYEVGTTWYSITGSTVYVFAGSYRFRATYENHTSPPSAIQDVAVNPNFKFVLKEFSASAKKSDGTGLASQEFNVNGLFTGYSSTLGEPFKFYGFDGSHSVTTNINGRPSTITISDTSTMGRDFVFQMVYGYVDVVDQNGKPVPGAAFNYWKGTQKTYGGLTDATGKAGMDFLPGDNPSLKVNAEINGEEIGNKTQNLLDNPEYKFVAGYFNVQYLDENDNGLGIIPIMIKNKATNQYVTTQSTDATGNLFFYGPNTGIYIAEIMFNGQQWTIEYDASTTKTIVFKINRTDFTIQDESGTKMSGINLYRSIDPSNPAVPYVLVGTSVNGLVSLKQKPGVTYGYRWGEWMGSTSLFQIAAVSGIQTHLHTARKVTFKAVDTRGVGVLGIKIEQVIGASRTLIGSTDNLGDFSTYRLDKGNLTFVATDRRGKEVFLTQEITSNRTFTWTLVYVEAGLHTSVNASIGGGIVTWFNGSSEQTFGTTTTTTGRCGLAFFDDVVPLRLTMFYQNKLWSLTQNINANPYFDFKTISVTWQLHQKVGSSTLVPSAMALLYDWTNTWKNMGVTTFSTELAPGTWQAGCKYMAVDLPNLTQDITADNTFDWYLIQIDLDFQDSDGVPYNAGQAAYNVKMLNTFLNIGTFPKTVYFPPSSWEFRNSYNGQDSFKTVAVTDINQTYKIIFNTIGVSGLVVESNNTTGIKDVKVTYNKSGTITTIGTTGTDGKTSSVELMPIPTSYTFGAEHYSMTASNKKTVVIADTPLKQAIKWVAIEVTGEVLDKDGVCHAGDIFQISGDNVTWYDAPDKTCNAKMQLLDYDWYGRFKITLHTIEFTSDVIGPQDIATDSTFTVQMFEGLIRVRNPRTEGVSGYKIYVSGADYDPDKPDNRVYVGTVDVNGELRINMVPGKIWFWAYSMYYERWFAVNPQNVTATNNTVTFTLTALMLKGTKMDRISTDVGGASFGIRSSSVGGAYFDPIAIGTTGSNPAIFYIPTGPDMFYDIKMLFSPVSSVTPVVYQEMSVDLSDPTLVDPVTNCIVYIIKCPLYGDDYQLLFSDDRGGGIAPTEVMIKYSAQSDLIENWSPVPGGMRRAPLPIDVVAKFKDGDNFAKYIWRGIDPDPKQRVNYRCGTNMGEKITKYPFEP